VINIIRRMDAFYERHPTIAFLIAICCVFAIMEIAHQWDRDDDTAIRIQMMGVRGAT
jgi:hypothetical protein